MPKKAPTSIPRSFYIQTKVRKNGQFVDYSFKQKHRMSKVQQQKIRQQIEGTYKETSGMMKTHGEVTTLANGKTREEAVYNSQHIKVNERHHKKKTLEALKRATLKQQGEAAILAAILYFCQQMVSQVEGYTVSKGEEIFAKRGLALFKAFALSSAVNLNSEAMTNGPFTPQYLQAVTGIMYECIDMQYELLNKFADEEEAFFKNPDWTLSDMSKMIERWGHDYLQPLQIMREDFTQLRYLYLGPDYANTLLKQQIEEDIQTTIDVAAYEFKMIGQAYKAFELDGGLKEFTLSPSDLQAYAPYTSMFATKTITRADLGLPDSGYKGLLELMSTIDSLKTTEIKPVKLDDIPT